MPKITKSMLRPIGFATALSLALAGCESSEDRAERHYQSALALIADGRMEPALVDLRNVFKYNNLHREARQLYADTVLEQGRVKEAYGQYLRLVEQYPDIPEARIALAEIAQVGGDWAEVERHGEAAIALAPEDPRVKAISAALDYRQAVVDEDPAGKAAAAVAARAVLDEQPDNQVARRILVVDLISGSDTAAALAEVEEALKRDPEAIDLNEAKLELLIRDEDNEGIGTHLKYMASLQPDREELQESLRNWYLYNQDIEGAAAYMRELAERHPDPAKARLSVAQLYSDMGQPEEATAELDRLIAAAGDAPEARLYRAVAAGRGFEQDNPTPAIAEMRAILEGAPATDDTRKITLMLVRMLVAADQVPEAQTLVEEVITADPTNVEALKMRASWRIEGDRAGDAITDLRAALGQAPRDASIMTLMAEAYLRDGSRDLALDSLASAFRVSDGGAGEAVRYARALLSNGQTAPARQVLNEARAVNPRNLQILSILAELALSERNWPDVEEVVNEVEQIAGPEAEQIVSGMRTALTLAQSSLDDSIALLQRQVELGGDDANRSAALLALARLQSGDAQGASEALVDALARDPENMQLRMLRVRLNLATGKTDAAEAELKEILAIVPGAEVPIQQLHRIMIVQGRPEEASALLKAGIEAAPGSVQLRMMRGAELTAAEQIEPAIETFEALYAENSNNTLVANNLATLLGTYRDDADSLERASVIARRLRGLENPAFQDTYGWIEYRRGNYDEAIAYLEPAARGLIRDPLVQYHLGMAFLAKDRASEAASQFRRALELAGDSGLPQFETARTELARLESAADSETGGIPTPVQQ